MGRKKDYYLIIDTETCNTIDQPLPYDIGYAICDRQGNIYLEKSFIVAETFLDMKDVMSSAYYNEKIPQYWENIKNGTRIIKSVWNIRKEIHQDIKKFNVKQIGAYNMAFDKRALNNLVRYCTKSRIRWFFPFGMSYFCVWSMACQVLLNTTSYIKFALHNGFISQAQNVQTSAECAYRFLVDSPEFIESHTGLEDVRIEIAILAKCFATHKKMDKKINNQCWKIPQVKKAEILKKAR